MRTEYFNTSLRELKMCKNETVWNNKVRNLFVRVLRSTYHKPILRKCF